MRVEEIIGWIDVGTWPESGPDGTSEVTVWERPDGPQTTHPADTDDLLQWILLSCSGRLVPTVEPLKPGPGWKCVMSGRKTFVGHTPFEAVEACVRYLGEPL